MRRGVNARLTSLRSFVCSGGSIMIIIGMLVGLVGDHLEQDAVARHERVGVEQAVEHVVVAAERVEAVLLVPVQGRLVAEAPPDRIRVGVDRVVVRVVVELGGGHWAASRIWRTMVSGSSGWSSTVTPCCASASATALNTAAGAPIAPPSPTPL